MQAHAYIPTYIHADNPHMGHAYVAITRRSFVFIHTGIQTYSYTYIHAGNPHMGHAYEAITADIIARWHRVYGRQVFFLTGKAHQLTGLHALVCCGNAWLCIARWHRVYGRQVFFLTGNDYVLT